MYSVYVPLAGLAIFAGVLIDKALRPIRDTRALVALLAAFAIGLGVLHVKQGALDVGWYQEEHALIRRNTRSSATFGSR